MNGLNSRHCQPNKKYLSPEYNLYNFMRLSFNFDFR